MVLSVLRVDQVVHLCRSRRGGERVAFISRVSSCFCVRGCVFDCEADEGTRDREDGGHYPLVLRDDWQRHGQIILAPLPLDPAVGP